MNRRELLKMVAAATGGAVIGGEFFLAGCKNPEAASSAVFAASDISLLDEVAETIFPKTGTPGAKDAKVGEFMTVMVNDCYPKADQEEFHAGMKKLNEACNKMHSHSFMDASADQRKALLVSLEQEAKDYNKSQSEKDKPVREKLNTENKGYDFVAAPKHYYTMMKQLTILGYFTSKEGRTGATRYEPVPGKYIGDYDYKKGDKIITGLN